MLLIGDKGNGDNLLYGAVIGKAIFRLFEESKKLGDSVCLYTWKYVSSTEIHHKKA